MGDTQQAALYAAAAGLYQSFPPKLLLAQFLISQLAAAPDGQWISPVISSYAAAERLGISVNDMLQLLRYDPCISVFQSSDPMGAPVINVTFDQSALLAAANRQALPPVAGYVRGVYPIRPGALNCSFYMKHSHCDYQQQCVYNHPAEVQQYLPQAGYHSVQQQVPGGLPPAPPAVQMPHPAVQMPHPPWQHQQHQQAAAHMHHLPMPYHAAPPPVAAGMLPTGGQYGAAGAAGVPQMGYSHMQQGAPQGAGTGPQQHQYQQQQPLPPPPQQQLLSQQQPPPPPQQQQQQQQQQHPAVGDARMHPSRIIESAAAPASSVPYEPVPATGQQQQQQQQQQQLLQPLQMPPSDSGGPPSTQHGDGPSAATDSPGRDMGSALLAALQKNMVLGAGVDVTRGNSNTDLAGGAAAQGTRDNRLQNRAAAAELGITDGAGTSYSYGAGGVDRGDAGSVSSSSSSSKQAKAVQGPPAGGTLHPKGIFLQGIPPNTTKAQLEAIFAPYGRVVQVVIIEIKWRTNKCAFVDFATEAAAQQVLKLNRLQMGDCSVLVLPKVTKAQAAKALKPGDGSHATQQATFRGSAGGTSSAAAAAASKLLGVNELGLPKIRGAPNCPYFLGTGLCRFRMGCKYHHPSHALHPECVLQDRTPVRYNVNLMPTYARLVNFTERIWEYGSCVESQLKIWLARHLLAKENSGCAMFDESAAVPAAPEDAVPDDPSQPLGAYSCSMEEAGQVLQLLWKAAPDDAAKQEMPYTGRLWELLSEDPYYDLATDPRTNGHSIRLRLGRIKELLNY